ncbi:MAG: hypothetical protein GXP56_03935 [Deltaproteobacteria bacterium]|nr:hypothetical protein [Deltaproteobacteria bacterium]
MDYTVEQIQGFCITGIKTRTDNTKAMQVIPKIWEQFFKENTMDKIKDLVPGSGLYAVYTGYESDEHGEYDFIIGTRTYACDGNNDFMSLEISNGSYAVFTAKNNEQVAPAWPKIWQIDLKRAYISDFEWYDPKTGEVKIFVGIK